MIHKIMTNVGIICAYHEDLQHMLSKIPLTKFKDMQLLHTTKS